MNVNYRDENIVNIAMMAAEMLKDGRIERDEMTGHAGLTEAIVALADKFEERYAGVDWNSDERDYWVEIDAFAEKELLERYGIEKENLNVENSKDPVVVCAVAGSVKHELFSGNYDQCKAFCEECNWSFMDENEFVWDLEMEDSRETDLSANYFIAVDYYSEKHGQDIDSEFYRVHADKLVLCCLRGLDCSTVDDWVQYENLCGEDLTFDEYRAAEGSLGGSPYEVGDEDFETISSIKESVNNYRASRPLLDESAALEQKIQAAQVLGADSSCVAGAPVKSERDARQ